MKITKNLSPSADDLEILNSNFWHFVTSSLPGLPAESRDRKFLFSAYEGSEFVGGISGNVYWNGLEIDTLWVMENYRKQGIGNQLLTAAEKFARANAAVVSFLKTFDAIKFYQKMGYQVYGQLEDRPIGTVLFHMKKRLD